MTIVYTTILGGSDSLKPAPKGADRCVCYVDQPWAHPDSKGWTLEPWHLYEGDPRRVAWNLRCISHRLFPEADRTIWIDASFTLTDLPRLLKDTGTAPIAALRHHRRRSCYEEGRQIVKMGQALRQDIDPQLAAYRSVGFTPQHLSVSCILVRDNSTAVQRFNETWLSEIRTHRGDNTQLSLDYAAWASHLTIKGLAGSRHSNPYSTHDHEDHKKRRRPYDSEVAA